MQDRRTTPRHPEAEARDADPAGQVTDRGDDEDEQEWVIAENAHAAREPTNQPSQAFAAHPPGDNRTLRRRLSRTS